MSYHEFCYPIGELQKIFPRLFAYPAAQVRLELLPSGQSLVELRFAGSGQSQPAFSPVFSAAFCNPASADHDCQCASEGSAVDGEHCSHLALGHFLGQGKKLEDGELRRAQALRSKGLVIELREGARRAAEVSAHAKQSGKMLLAHSR